MQYLKNSYITEDKSDILAGYERKRELQKLKSNHTKNMKDEASKLERLDKLNQKSATRNQIASEEGRKQTKDDKSKSDRLNEIYRKHHEKEIYYNRAKHLDHANGIKSYDAPVPEKEGKFATVKNKLSEKLKSFKKSFNIPHRYLSMESVNELKLAIYEAGNSGEFTESEVMELLDMLK